jgi:hypothetical protein
MMDRQSRHIGFFHRKNTDELSHHTKRAYALLKHGHLYEQRGDYEKALISYTGAITFV